MAITYSYRYDERYNADALKRHRSLSKPKLRWIGWPLKLVCALGLLALAAIGIFAKVYVVAGVAIFFLLLLALGPRLDYLRPALASASVGQQPRGFASASGLAYAEIKALF
jgi:hypothetical protein